MQVQARLYTHWCPLLPPDFGMGGILTWSFMFRKLCSGSTLSSIAITVWGQVDPRLGGAQIVELEREVIFCRPVLEKGARMARYENTVPLAESPTCLILENHPLTGGEYLVLGACYKHCRSRLAFTIRLFFEMKCGGW